MTLFRLGRIMGHIGNPPPEAEPWSILRNMGIDVELAKRAVHKLYFEFVPVKKNGKVVDTYEVYHDVFFIPNDSKHGSLFAMKYGTKSDG